MIWKGENFKTGTTHKVGFAINENLVLAWYCPTRPEPATTKEYQENVCKNDGTCADPTYLCTKDGYDKCYNDMARTAHNKKRTEHCAAAFAGDTAMAKEMQRMLNEKQAPTKPADRAALYKGCQENFYTAPAGTSDKDVMNKNLATDSWYGKKSAYNFASGASASG